MVMVTVVFTCLADLSHYHYCHRNVSNLCSDCYLDTNLPRAGSSRCNQQPSSPELLIGTLSTSVPLIENALNLILTSSYIKNDGVLHFCVQSAVDLSLR